MHNYKGIIARRANDAAQIHVSHITGDAGPNTAAVQGDVSGFGREGEGELSGHFFQLQLHGEDHLAGAVGVDGGVVLQVGNGADGRYRRDQHQTAKKSKKYSAHDGTSFPLDQSTAILPCTAEKCNEVVGKMSGSSKKSKICILVERRMVFPEKQAFLWRKVCKIA